MLLHPYNALNRVQVLSDVNQALVSWLVYLVSLFNGILTFVGYLMPKPFSKKNSCGTI